jgi:hypothetical protein
MADPHVLEGWGVVPITLNGTVKAGDLVGYNGTNYVACDANIASRVSNRWLFAQGVAGGYGVSGDVIRMYLHAVFEDLDAPFTANDMLYMSGSAGAITSTRPVTDGDLIQPVGYAYSTSVAYVHPHPEHEHDVWVACSPYVNTNSAWVADSGWVGQDNDATDIPTAATYYVAWRVPEYAVTLIDARLVLNSLDASAFDLDVTLAGAYDGAANNQDAGTAGTALDWEEADTDNILLTVKLDTELDVGFFTPGRNISILFDPDAITGDAHAMGVWFQYTCVC